MVTEFCAGGSVSTLMKPIGFVPEKWIIPILREVGEGLAWVHHRGTFHRDITAQISLSMTMAGYNSATSVYE